MNTLVVEAEETDTDKLEQEFVGNVRDARRQIDEVRESIHDTFDTVENLAETEELDPAAVKRAISDLDDQIAALSGARDSLRAARQNIEDYQSAKMLEDAYEGEGDSVW